MDDNEQAAAPAAATNPADQTPPNAPTPEQASDAPEGQAADAEGDDEDDDQSADKPKTRSAERREARKRQLEAERQELAYYRSQATRQPLTLEERIGPAPNPAQYRDQVSYAAAQAAYSVQKSAANSSMAAEQRQTDAFANRSVQAREARAAVMELAFKETAPDYDRAMQAIQYTTVPQTALDAIAESDLRPQLLYHLGKNPQKASALSQMTPLQAAKEIGRLEAQLSATPAPRTTQAPSPLTPLRGGTAGPTRTIADLAKSDDATAAIAALRAERAKQRA